MCRLIFAMSSWKLKSWNWKWNRSWNCNRAWLSLVWSCLESWIFKMTVNGPPLVPGAVWPLVDENHPDPYWMTIILNSYALQSISWCVGSKWRSSWRITKVFLVLLQSSGVHIPTAVVLDLSRLSFIFYSILPFGSSISSMLSTFSSLFLSCKFLKIQKTDNLIFV